MNTEKPSASQAKEALDAIQDSQQALLDESTPSAWISLVISLSAGLTIFGYGMTEHENQWALAIWIGAISFTISTALYIYSYRLKGVKVGLLPRSKGADKINVLVALAFAFLTSGSRLLRTEGGFEYAPHVCAILAAALFFWIQRKYPTGEVMTDGR